MRPQSPPHSHSFCVQLHYTWASRLVWPNGTDAWQFEKRESTEQRDVDEVRSSWVHCMTCTTCYVTHNSG